MEQVFSGVVVKGPPKPRRKKRDLLAFNIPPMHRQIHKTYAPPPNKTPMFHRRPETRIVQGVIRAGKDWTGREKWNIPRNSDAPIIDPDRRKNSKADSKGFRYYTPQVFKALHREPIRDEKRRVVASQWTNLYPTWDQTEQNSDAHRSGVAIMEHW